MTHEKAADLSSIFLQRRGFLRAAFAGGAGLLGGCSPLGSDLFAGEALASRGCTVAIPDYRLYPDVRFPDFLADCARAVRWTFDHAAR